MKWKQIKRIIFKKKEDLVPKSKNETLCSLTKWYFTDQTDFLVNIPSEGIHAFYGLLGYEKAIDEMIKYLQKLKEELK